MILYSIVYFKYNVKKGVLVVLAFIMRHAIIYDMIQKQKTFLYLQIGAVEDILEHYKNVTMTVTALSEKYNVTPRTIQRLVKKHGIVRSIAEANKVTAKIKDYSSNRVADHLKVKRNFIKRSTRYKIIANQPFCTICGSKPEDGVRLEIDHIDDNPSNNDPHNLQVLCMFCNQGKTARYNKGTKLDK